MVSKEVEQEILEGMGYSGTANSCGECKHFVAETDKRCLHCNLNPGVKLFRISPDGHCNHFETKVN